MLPTCPHSYLGTVGLALPAPSAQPLCQHSLLTIVPFLSIIKIQKKVFKWTEIPAGAALTPQFENSSHASEQRGQDQKDQSLAWTLGEADGNLGSTPDTSQRKRQEHREGAGGRRRLVASSP